jgi:hypothetical protein
MGITIADLEIIDWNAFNGTVTIGQDVRGLRYGITERGNRPTIYGPMGGRELSAMRTMQQFMDSELPASA